MDGISITIIVICQAIIIFIAGLYIKKILPSYMNEKGKNLATKEDIQEITRKTEKVRDEFKQNFELFSSDIKFKYDFYYEQYAKLYSKLYANVMQSEYVRHYIKISKEEDISFDEAPFLEISKTHRTTQIFSYNKETGSKSEIRNIDIETPISQFNKMQMCEYIIEMGEFASQELLKIAVSYRFANSRYDGNFESGNSVSDSKAANNEELRLIRLMVCRIVKEYNGLRKELQMEYNETELETGIPLI